MPDAGETTPVEPPAPAPVDETTDEAPAVSILRNCSVNLILKFVVSN